MLYDRRDFGLMRLAGAYQWLPLAPQLYTNKTSGHNYSTRCRKQLS